MSSIDPSMDDQRPGLKPPQFRLWTLFFAITALCGLLVAIRAVGPLGGSVLLFLAVAVFAHVAGNAIGCRLRANGSIQLGQGGAEEHVGRPTARPGNVHYAPVTQLRVRKGLGRSMLVLTGVGAVLGAAVGGWLLTNLNWERATVINVAIGTISFAVLGGLWGFWASSFLRVFWGALVQAHRHSNR